MVGFINKCRYKKVITLSKKEVEEIIIELLGQLEKNGMESPSYIISILNGGKYIGDIVYLRYRDCAGKKEILFKRSITKKKESKFVKFILKVLPYSFLNILRNLEECFLQLFSSKEGIVNVNQSNYIILQTLKDIRRDKVTLEFPVLIVDDAIDSGTTVKTIKEVLIGLAP